MKRRLYVHHEIYVNDCRVIDFSGVRNILEKPKALVQARSLKEFEGKRGIAEKVEQPGKFLGGLGFWPGARVGASARGGRAASGGSLSGCRHPRGLPAQRFQLRAHSKLVQVRGARE